MNTQAKLFQCLPAILISFCKKEKASQESWSSTELYEYNSYIFRVQVCNDVAVRVELVVVVN